MTSKGDSAIIPVTQYAIAQPESSDVIAAMQQALAPGETLSFTSLRQLRVPAGGGQTWEFEDGQAVRTFDGVLLLRQPVRAYWHDPFSGEGAPPDCASNDGITGTGDPGGECSICPKNAWGSAADETGQERKGKACRQIARLFVITPDTFLPLLLPAPPSSYKRVLTYVLRLADRGLRYHHVVTRFGLEKAESSGFKYSAVKLEQVGLLSEGERAAMDRHRARMEPALRGIAVEAEEAQHDA